MTQFPTSQRPHAIGVPFAKRTQSQSLLKMISLAIEQRLPMAPLLREFAEDHSFAQKMRLQRLAGILETGSSLPAALEQVPHVLPVESVLAIRFGTQSGTLPTTLQNLIEQSRHREDVRTNARLSDTLIYPAVVLLVMAMISIFLLFKVLPVFEKLMSESGLEPTPLAFQGFAFAGSLFVNYWWLFVGAALLLVWILWTEWPGRSLRHGLARPWLDMGTADVLQNLSVVTEAGRPIPGAISTLARFHHDPTLRQKLLFVHNAVEHGADLWSTLRSVKLLTSAEVASIEASEQVGNRSWVLAQLSTSKRRRARRRLELLRQFAEPASVLLLGGVVFTICLAVFVPLVKMILLDTPG